MSCEDQVFHQIVCHESELLAFGFQKTEDGYRYTKEFMDGGFRAEIVVRSDGGMHGRCIDCDTNDIYIPLYLEEHGGHFVCEVRKAYLDILQNFASACGERLFFLKPQSNRMAKYIFDKYGEKPDFPFKNDDINGVFRNPANRKWYAVVIRLRRGKIDKTASEEMIEIVNFKAKPEDHEVLLKKTGYYPAYHMKKSSWLTVILDDSVADQELYFYLDRSRSFTLDRPLKPSGRRVRQSRAPAEDL